MQPLSVSPESVRAALDKLLVSQTLGSAKRSAALLEFLVRAVLEGRGRELKEYTLGVELYYATEGAATS